MNARTTIPIRRAILAATAALVIGLSAVVSGQGGGAAASARSAKDSAPIDLTGYWVAVVNKEWRFRMVIPARGDFYGPIGGIPINTAARKVAETWDPSKDEAAGEACRGYGAAGLMRVPGRLHITWQDDDTMRVDTDAGTQTRLFQFGASPPTGGRPTWQGHSVARWPGLPAAAAGGDIDTSADGPVFGSLEVVTTNMRPGYLRRNGVPYSAQASMTEYWDMFREPDGTDWLVITATVVDPMYLQMPYETSPAFKREPDGSKWDPSPCSARW